MDNSNRKNESDLLAGCETFSRYVSVLLVMKNVVLRAMDFDIYDPFSGTLRGLPENRKSPQIIANHRKSA